VTWFNSCDYKPTAIGDDRQIFVFADSLLWLDIKEDIEQTFHKYVYTPRAEKSFIISWRSLNKLNDLKGRRNIFFIGTTKSGSEVNDYLLSFVPQEFINSVNNEESLYFFKDDLFLNQQISMFIIGKNKESLLSNFKQKSSEIFYNFNRKYMARLKDRIYQKGEQFDLEEYLVDNFGYKIRIQHDYFIANQEPKEKFVWLRRVDPDRWISIWKKDWQEVNLSPDSLFSIRNEMTKKYYDGDYIVEDETSITRVPFISADNIKITGTWRNDSLLVGGPFRTYVVPHPEEDAYYFVDIAVMDPTQDKKPFLDQLEVIAGTFSFENKK
jgi:hypothetical protein